jgi:GT2 family glycosyltransferase
LDRFAVRLAAPAPPDPAGARVTAAVAAPDIAVVVPTRNRELRLRWLLDALEEQTLARERFEVVVVHDSTDGTQALLGEHPLAQAGVLHALRAAPGASAAVKRNAGWRAARAPSIAFTDDDCRPPAEWLERALEAAVADPQAIHQGTTVPDPDEHGLLVAPHAYTQNIVPPQPWGQTCNIVYPRNALEQVGGFDERLSGVEDVDLAARARRAGVRYLAAPEVVTYHAVHTPWLPTMLRSARRWADLPAVVKRSPELRRHYPARYFWKWRHFWMIAAACGAAGARADRRTAALALPWLASAMPSYGPGLRSRLRGVTELPGRLAIDVAEVAVLARSSVRHRSMLL